MPATIDIPQQIISIDAKTLVKFSVNGGLAKLKKLFIREEKMAKWAIPLRDWVVNELEKGTETLHVSQSGVILPKFVTPSLVVWACIFLAVCDLEVECTDSEFDPQKRKIVSWQSRECGVRATLEGNLYHSRYYIPRPLKSKKKEMAEKMEKELEEVNSQLEKISEDDEPEELAIKPENTVDHELENIPTAVIATFNEDNEDDNESGDDSVIPDEKDFEFEKEEKEMRKIEEPEEKGIMDDMPSETGGDFKQFPDPEEFAKRFAETAKNKKDSGATVFAVSQKEQEQKLDIPTTDPVVQRERRSYIRRKPKLQEKPIEIPAGSRGLILNMIEAGEKEARDKDQKLELFGNLYGKFDREHCLVIELLLSEAQENRSPEYSFGYFVSYQDAIRAVFGKPKPTFYQWLAGVRNPEAALFTNRSGAKGKNARIVPVPMAFARARNLFAEEFLIPPEPETSSPPDLNINESLDEARDAPGYWGKPPKMSMESFVQAFSETILADPDLLPGAIILCNMLKSFPNATRGLEIVLSLLDKIGRLSDAENVAEKARQELYENPIIRAFSGKLGF